MQWLYFRHLRPTRSRWYADIATTTLCCRTRISVISFVFFLGERDRCSLSKHCHLFHRLLCNFFFLLCFECLIGNLSYFLWFYFEFQAYYDTTADIWEFGTLITSSCIFVMLIHIASEFRSWVTMQQPFNNYFLMIFVFISIITSSIRKKKKP